MIILLLMHCCPRINGDATVAESIVIRKYAQVIDTGRLIGCYLLFPTGSVG